MFFAEILFDFFNFDFVGLFNVSLYGRVDCNYQIERVLPIFHNEIVGSDVGEDGHIPPLIKLDLLHALIRDHHAHILPKCDAVGSEDYAFDSFDDDGLLIRQKLDLFYCAEY